MVANIERSYTMHADNDSIGCHRRFSVVAPNAHVSSDRYPHVYLDKGRAQHLQRYAESRTGEMGH